MSFEQKINDKIKDAMRSKDSGALRTLRAVKAEILKEKTKSGGSGDVSEEDALKILTKMAKQRRDSLSIFKEQNREDLAEKEAEELAVIEQFLPKQLDEVAVKEKLELIVEKTGASSPADMGKVMALAMKELAGQADGKLVSKVVRELLTK